jgi:predicted DNA-binding transcriptional regulator AlpA
LLATKSKKQRDTYLETTPIPEIGFVPEPQIIYALGICRASWWAGVRAGRYPAGIKIGPRCTVWDAEAIRDLIRRIAAGDVPTPGTYNPAKKIATLTAKGEFALINNDADPRP